MRGSLTALVYAFWLPRGRGRACPARGFPISARLPYTAGPHICGPQAVEKPPSAREVPRRGGGREPCHSPKYFGQPHSSLPHRLRAEPPHRGGQGVSTPFSTAYGTLKTVPYKAPVNPICREGSRPLRGRLPDTGHSQAAARTPRGASGTPPPTTICELSRHRSRSRCLRHGIPRQMFHVEHLPDFFVGKTPFLSLLFVL